MPEPALDQIRLYFQLFEPDRYAAFASDDEMCREYRAMMDKVQASYDSVCPRLTEETTTEEVWIPCPDGVRLRTVLVLPDGLPGPYPTIVMRSCYPFQEGMLHNQAVGFARHGFAVAYQWCRGLGGSEGQWEPNVHDRADGLSLVNWLQNQDWVKNMGYVGGSYLSMTGWIMADAIPDKMKTMYLTVYGTVRHTSAWREGLFRQDILTAWAKGNAGFPIAADYLESARFRPQVEVDEKLWGCRLDWYRDWITHPSKADPYWAEGHWALLESIPGKLNIPVFVGEGWYDHHLGSMLEGFATLSAEAARHSVLQINPGNHSLTPVIPGQPRQKNAAIDEAAQQMRWFYNILVKEELPPPGVDYYMIGADEWRHYPSYPPQPTGEAVFYLDGQHLSPSPGEASARHYTYDPNDPVMSHGAESLFQLRGAHGGALEQPGPDWRPDVLSYISDPLTAPLDVVGPIQARLWVASDAPDTCFTIKVMEVDKDGRAWHVRNGITTLGWRNDATEVQPYTGGPVEITLSCWDVAWQFQPGSRLRVDISSSNFPEYSIHPNTRELWSLADTVQTARQTVLSGPEHPSRLLLPLDKK